MPAMFQPLFFSPYCHSPLQKTPIWLTELHLSLPREINYVTWNPMESQLDDNVAQIGFLLSLPLSFPYARVFHIIVINTII